MILTPKYHMALHILPESLGVEGNRVAALAVLGILGARMVRAQLLAHLRYEIDHMVSKL